MDLKYDIMKRPNVVLSADGKAEPYIHGDTRDAMGTIFVTGRLKANEGEKGEPQESRFELLT